MSAWRTLLWEVHASPPACRVCNQEESRGAQYVSPLQTHMQGPFNFEERGVAGLPRGWYDADHWPQPERAVMEALKAQQRAERQGRKAGEAGDDGSAASSGSAAAATEAAAAKTQHAERVRILPLAEQGGEQLQQLRQRLAAMLEIELHMS